MKIAALTLYWYVKYCGADSGTWHTLLFHPAVRHGEIRGEMYLAVDSPVQITDTRAWVEVTDIECTKVDTIDVQGYSEFVVYRWFCNGSIK